MAEATTTAAAPVIEHAQTPAEAMEDEWFDLLPVEMKLIKYSLALGIGLLVIFVIIFRVLPSL